MLHFVRQISRRPSPTTINIGVAVLTTASVLNLGRIHFENIAWDRKIKGDLLLSAASIDIKLHEINEKLDYFLKKDIEISKAKMNRNKLK